MPAHTSMRPAVSMVKPISNAPQVKNDEYITQELWEFDPIKVVIDDNCDLETVHAKILDYFKKVRARIDHLKKCKPMAINFVRSTEEEKEKSRYQNQLNAIDKELNSLSKLSKFEYQVAVKPYLDEFREIRKNMGVYVMGRKKGASDFYYRSKKIELIKEFCDEAIHYCLVLKVERGTAGLNCSNCGNSLSQNGKDSYCGNCGNLQEQIEVGECLDYGEKKNTVKKTGIADNIKNFRDIIDQFEVSTNINIPNKIMDSIRETLENYQSLNIKTLSKSDLVTVMKLAKVNSMWFKHLNKIYFLLTGKKPESVEKHIPNLMKRIEYFAEIHEEIKNQDRSNFIHGLHIFWMFLMNEGYTPNPDDFVLLKSRDVELNNIRTIERGFVILRKTHPELEWNIFEFS